MADAFRPFYDAARALFPLLPQWYELTNDGVTPEYRGLNAGGLPIFVVPLNYTLTADEPAHEAGHAYFTLLARTRPQLDLLTTYWIFRGFPGTWHDALIESNATTGNPAWQLDPRESWAECFARAVVPTHNEKTLTYGKDVDPFAARAFFQQLAPIAAPTTVVPAPTVLLHNSHRADGKTDGWSGAPGEAQYICDILNPRIVAHCRDLGIEVVVVNGDLVFHPAYAEDYRLFVAPHYDADSYGSGGWFWDRAAASPTFVDDDRFGGIFQRRYSALAGVPAFHDERRNANTRDYYAFRWTTDKTPGVIVELGVGWGADKDWLRANVDSIAWTFAYSIAEFIGIAVGTTGEEDDMNRDTFNAWFKEEYDKAGVAALFDRMKTIDGQLADQNRADDARDAAQQTALDKKADKGHAHSGNVTVS